MTTTQVFQNGDSQSVRLPSGFEFADKEVAIRRDGEAVILEPIKRTAWPKDFFTQIRIDDPAFCRPDQGEMPAAPQIEPA
jgi:virulence-associated protein VagC